MSRVYDRLESATLLLTGGGSIKDRLNGAWRHYLASLEAEDVPHAPMYDTSEALEDPQALHLQMTASAVHPVMGLFRTVRSPVSFDGERALDVRPPPTLGEHNDEVLRSLGLPDEELIELDAEGVIGRAPAAARSPR